MPMMYCWLIDKHKMAGCTRVKLGIFVLCCLFCKALAGRNQQLGNENWERLLQGEWLVKFYAPWCPACQNIAATWSTLALKAEKLGISVGEVDTSKEVGLSGRFMVVSLPTIYHVKDGEFRKYEGLRSLDGFMQFINEQEWRSIEPVPWWRSPGSYLMGCFAMMFKFSMVLKDAHELLTLTYGLPTWASYTIFGVSTVVAGLLLGAGIVFVSDFMFGATPAQPSRDTAPPSTEEPQTKPSKKEDKDSEEEENKTEEESGEKHMNEDEDSSVRKRVTGSAD